VLLLLLLLLLLRLCCELQVVLPEPAALQEPPADEQAL
jgi:hypothetical protein